MEDYRDIPIDVYSNISRYLTDRDQNSLRDVSRTARLGVDRQIDIYQSQKTLRDGLSFPIADAIRDGNLEALKRIKDLDRIHIERLFEYMKLGQEFKHFSIVRYLSVIVSINYPGDLNLSTLAIDRLTSYVYEFLNTYFDEDHPDPITFRNLTRNNNVIICDFIKEYAYSSISGLGSVIKFVYDNDRLTFNEMLLDHQKFKMMRSGQELGWCQRNILYLSIITNMFLKIDIFSNDMYKFIENLDKINHENQKVFLQLLIRYYIDHRAINDFRLNNIENIFRYFIRLIANNVNFLEKSIFIIFMDELRATTLRSTVERRNLYSLYNITVEQLNISDREMRDNIRQNFNFVDGQLIEQLMEITSIPGFTPKMSESLYQDLNGESDDKILEIIRKKDLDMIGILTACLFILNVRSSKVELAESVLKLAPKDVSREVLLDHRWYIMSDMLVHTIYNFKMDKVLKFIMNERTNWQLIHEGIIDLAVTDLFIEKKPNKCIFLIGNDIDSILSILKHDIYLKTPYSFKLVFGFIYHSIINGTINDNNFCINTNEFRRIDNAIEAKFINMMENKDMNLLNVLMPEQISIFYRFTKGLNKNQLKEYHPFIVQFYREVIFRLMLL